MARKLALCLGVVLVIAVFGCAKVPKPSAQEVALRVANETAVTASSILRCSDLRIRKTWDDDGRRVRATLKSGVVDVDVTGGDRPAHVRRNVCPARGRQ